MSVVSRNSRGSPFGSPCARTILQHHVSHDQSPLGTQTYRCSEQKKGIEPPMMKPGWPVRGQLDTSTDGPWARWSSEMAQAARGPARSLLRDERRRLGRDLRNT